MPKWESGSLRIASLLLVLAGYLALATVREFGPAMIAVPLVLFALIPAAERIDRAYPAYRQITRALQVAYIFFIPYTYITMGRVNALVALIVFIQAYSLLHVKTPRNYYHLFLMSFFLLITAAVQAPEPEIGLVFVLFVVSAVWSLAALRLDAEAHVHGIASVNRMETAYNGMPDDAHRHGWRVGLSIVTLCVAVIACTTGFFLFTPRIEAGLFGRSEQAPRQARTGLADRVRLGAAGTIQQDRTAVMYVQFPELDNGYFPGPKYWRSTTLTHYTGGEWMRRGLTDHMERWPDAPLSPFRRAHLGQASTPLRIDRPRVRDATRVLQQIYVDDIPDQGLPCLDLVQEVRVMGEPRGTRIRWDELNDLSVVLETTGQRRLSYVAWSEVGRPSPDALRRATDQYELVLARRDYALLTAHDLGEQAQQVAAEVMAGADTVYDKALAVRNWLSGPDFAYTTELPALPPRNPLDAFILEERRGHCELFGSAMALMLRSQGIPTRVVTGFRDGEWDEGRESYIIRQSDAHLWVEVLFPGLGWVVFDPSPRQDPEVGGIAAMSRSISRAVFQMKMFWYQNVVGFDSGFQLSRLRDVTFGVVGGEGLDWSGGFGGLNVVLPLALLLGLGGAAGIGVVVLLRGRGPVRRYVLTGDQARAVRLYRHIQRALRPRMRMRSRTDMTADELREDLEAADEAYRPALEALNVYNDVRFGLRPLPREEYNRLTRRLRQLRA